MDNPIRSFIDSQGYAVLDGGLATELERRGADLDHELWSARMLYEAPEMIEKVHLDFLRAGADVITSASYQASLQGFQSVGFGASEASALITRGVELAVRAREAFWKEEENRAGRLRPLVAASVGPYGASLADGSEYHGRYGIGREALRDFHRPRMALLAESGADLFAFETIPSREEAEVLVELLADFPDCWAWLSCSCRDGSHVSHGEAFADVAAIGASSPQMAAVGVNCTAPEYISPLLESVGEISLPFVVYPNSGERYRAEDNRWTGEAHLDFPVVDWYRRGARLIGGCCRTGTRDVSGIRRRLDGRTAIAADRVE